MILTLDDMGCDEASEEQKDMRLRCTGIGKPFVSAYFCVYLYIRPCSSLRDKQPVTNEQSVINCSSMR
jgi:hypothetical protein